MPATLVGLVIALVLLGPGFVYAATREAIRPAPDLTPLRELLRIAAASLALDLAALLVFWILRSTGVPTPDVGRLVRQGGPYLRADYQQLFAWGGGLLAGAAVLGTACAWLLPQRKAAPHLSAWWRLHAAKLDHFVYLGCELTDGSWVGGLSYSFAEDAKETQDRDLLVTGEISYRPAGGEMTVLPQVQAACVSAARIKFLTATYYPEPPAPRAMPDQAMTG